MSDRQSRNRIINLVYVLREIKIKCIKNYALENVLVIFYEHVNVSIFKILDKNSKQNLIHS